MQSTPARRCRSRVSCCGASFSTQLALPRPTSTRFVFSCDASLQISAAPDLADSPSARFGLAHGACCHSIAVLGLVVERHTLRQHPSTQGLQVLSSPDHALVFMQTEGNPEIRQIPWDDNDDFVQRWRNAQTGYPWIDAIMTQLRQWGWMHHLARHSVACFLTRGDLWCHWEKGRDVFDELLIDGDHFINTGNWQWLSASNFFYQFFRVYSPVSFGQKYDKEGKFVRHFLPVLKDMPAKYIYEPWKAPADVQKKANCIIGKDYPEPIVDHKEASQANKDKMKAAYDKHKLKGKSNASPAKRKRAS